MNSRIKYGVDHEPYAYQLSIGMESALSLAQVLTRAWKVTLVWALGANFNTKFCLVGSWKWDGAEELLKTEMWETITRRSGVFGKWIASIRKRVDDLMLRILLCGFFVLLLRFVVVSTQHKP